MPVISLPEHGKIHRKFDFQAFRMRFKIHPFAHIRSNTLIKTCSVVFLLVLLGK